MVRGGVYDITDYIDKHPGGRHVLEMSAGQDITYLMETSHPFTDSPWRLLGKYRIGRIAEEFVTYQAGPEPLWYEARQKVKVGSLLPAPSGWRLGRPVRAQGRFFRVLLCRGGWTIIVDVWLLRMGLYLHVPRLLLWHVSRLRTWQLMTVSYSNPHCVCVFLPLPRRLSMPATGVLPEEQTGP